MKTVPREFIIEAWERQCALTSSASSALMHQFMDEQPAIGIYLLVCDEQLGGDAGSDQLIPLAAAVWEAMTRMRGRRLKSVQPKTIERADQTSTRTLETLEESSEFEWRESVTSLFSGCNQQPLLAFCVEILMAGNEEAPELTPQSVGMEFLLLKSAIDCFDQ